MRRAWPQATLSALLAPLLLCGTAAAQSAIKARVGHALEGKKVIDVLFSEFVVQF